MANQYAKYDEAAVSYYAEIAGGQRAEAIDAAHYQQGYMWADMGFAFDATKLPTVAHFQGWRDCINGVAVVFLDGMAPLLYGAQ